MQKHVVMAWWCKDAGPAYLLRSKGVLESNLLCAGEDMSWWLGGMIGGVVKRCAIMTIRLLVRAEDMSW